MVRMGGYALVVKSQNLCSKRNQGRYVRTVHAEQINRSPWMEGPRCRTDTCYGMLKNVWPHYIRDDFGFPKYRDVVFQLSAMSIAHASQSSCNRFSLARAKYHRCTLTDDQEPNVCLDGTPRRRGCPQVLSSGLRLARQHRPWTGTMRKVRLKDRASGWLESSGQRTYTRRLDAR